jgi:hypothetical protein
VRHLGLEIAPLAEHLGGCSLGLGVVPEQGITVLIWERKPEKRAGKRSDRAERAERYKRDTRDV